MSAALERAKERLRLLTEMQRITPPVGAERPSPDALRALLERRQALIDEWPAGDVDGVGEELRTVVAEIRRTVEELLARDAALTVWLTDARGQVLRVLQRGKAAAPPEARVKRTI